MLYNNRRNSKTPVRLTPASFHDLIIKIKHDADTEYQCRVQVVSGLGSQAQMRQFTIGWM